MVCIETLIEQGWISRTIQATLLTAFGKLQALAQISYDESGCANDQRVFTESTNYNCNTEASKERIFPNIPFPEFHVSTSDYSLIDGPNVTVLEPWQLVPEVPYSLRYVIIPKVSVAQIQLDRKNGQVVTLGAGTFATAYKGVLRESGESIVTKNVSLRCSSTAAVYREAKITKLLYGTGVVPKVHGIASYSRASTSIVEEFISGQTLLTLLYNGLSKLTQRDWLLVCYKLTIALLNIHEYQVCHNDIKSDNVVIDIGSVGEPKVTFIDFGHATFRDIIDKGSFVEPEEDIYPFLAPEVKLQGKTSVASDIFSLGYIFREMSEKGVLGLKHLSEECLNVRVDQRPCLVIIALALEDQLAKFECWEL